MKQRQVGARSEREHRGRTRNVGGAIVRIGKVEADGGGTVDHEIVVLRDAGGFDFGQPQNGCGKIDGGMAGNRHQRAREAPYFAIVVNPGRDSVATLDQALRHFATDQSGRAGQKYSHRGAFRRNALQPQASLQRMDWQ